MPGHVAIIMDGNGRWAKRRGLARIEGHRKGVENVRAIVKAADEFGIRVLTLFAFSAENWRRPPDEVSALMDLLDRFLRSQRAELMEKGLRLQAIGRLQDLPDKVRATLEETIAATASNPRGVLNLALSYGARTEVVDAARAYAEAVREGREDPAQLDYECFAGYLYTRDLPDPDLVIRTSGETRLSNFLLLQAAYAEFYFSQVPWPEFDREAFIEALRSYQDRERRFGRTGEQLRADPSSDARPAIVSSSSR